MEDRRIAIFFVTEDEYPKLQKACPGDFPFTYPEFVARVEEGIKHMPEGVPVTKINVDVDEFIAWCAKSKVQPKNTTRSKYAALMLHKRTFH